MLFIITLFIHGLETHLYWSAIHGIKHSDEKKKITESLVVILRK